MLLGFSLCLGFLVYVRSSAVFSFLIKASIFVVRLRFSHFCTVAFFSEGKLVPRVTICIENRKFSKLTIKPLKINRMKLTKVAKFSNQFGISGFWSLILFRRPFPQPFYRPFHFVQRENITSFLTVFRHSF